MAHVEKTFIVSLNTKLVPDWNEKREMDAFDFSVEIMIEEVESLNTIPALYKLSY